MWSAGEQRLYAAGQAAGVAVFLIAFLGSFDSDDLGAQIPWINLGVIGLTLSGAINVSWLLAGRRRVGSRRRDLVADVVVRRTTSPVERSRSSSLVWVPGTVRIHRSGCVFVVGKDTQPIDDAAVVDLALRPCEVCR